ncbi:hypothetical protein K456DRAFT_182959 [Colletotrichum gloeosporioides 23]|nr:hypothetical protein K456DRAFT_182959 [Colletotrichum gloeosporioides 23]
MRCGSRVDGKMRTQKHWNSWNQILVTVQYGWVVYRRRRRTGDKDLNRNVEAQQQAVLLGLCLSFVWWWWWWEDGGKDGIGIGIGISVMAASRCCATFPMYGVSTSLACSSSQT